MATGEVNMYRRFAVLDRLGIVRTVDGSLGGTWSSADSQVMALSAQYECICDKHLRYT